MRFKGRKWAIPFFIISLAVAGLFGASAAVINNQTQETPVVEKAEAATNAPPTIWFRENGNWLFSGASLGIWIWPTGGQGHFYKAKYDSTVGLYYFPVYDRTCSKVQFIRVASGDTTEDGSDTYPSSWKSIEVSLSSTNNWYNLNSYDSVSLNSTSYCGYYLVGGGSFGGWTRSDSNYLSATANDIGAVTSFSVAADSTELKVLWVEGRGSTLDWSKPAFNYYNLDNNHSYPASVLTEAASDNNIKLNKAATYDFYFTTSHTISIVKHLTITLNANGGSVTPTSWPVTVTYTGASSNKYAPDAENPLPTPTRDGYTGRWYTASTGGTEVTNNTSTESLSTNTSIYAQWTANVYTITYDRNKNDGTQRTQSKNHDTSVTAYNPDNLITYNTKWNPSDGKSFVHWNTKYQDDGDDVLSGGTITTNKSFYLYYIEDWFEFRYKIGTGSWVNMSYNMTGAPSGIIAQFASTAQELTHGLKFSFQVNKRDGTNHTENWVDISPTYSGENNNYNTTTGIILSTNDQVFLKLTKSNGTYYYDVWVPGISLCTVVVGSESYSTNPDTSDQYVTTGLVRANNGDDVKVAFGGTPIDTYLDPSSASGCFSSDGEGTVTCIMTGEYTVYVKRGGGGKHDYIYISRNEAASANYLAQIFNTIIGAICTDIESGSKGLSDLQNAWGSKSGTTLYNHFHGQIAATLAYFSTSSTTEDPDILACVARYDYIELKYGKTALPDFIGRNNGYQNAPRAISSFTPFDLIGEEGNSLSTIIIIIASSVSLLSITALSVLLVRKRKRNEQ